MNLNDFSTNKPFDDFKRWGELGRAETRRRVMKHFGNKCQVCGIEFDNEKKIYPHVHHLKYEYKFDINNFELVCKVCHGANHPKSKYYIPKGYGMS